MLLQSLSFQRDPIACSNISRELISMHTFRKNSLFGVLQAFTRFVSASNPRTAVFFLFFSISHIR